MNKPNSHRSILVPSFRGYNRSKGLVCVVTPTESLKSCKGKAPWYGTEYILVRIILHSSSNWMIFYWLDSFMIGITEFCDKWTESEGIEPLLIRSISLCCIKPHMTQVFNARQISPHVRLISSHQNFVCESGPIGSGLPTGSHFLVRQMINDREAVLKLACNLHQLRKIK